MQTSAHTQLLARQLKAVHREATTTLADRMAGELQAALGQRLVAYAAGVRTPKLVGRWAAGTHRPGPEVEERLRILYRAFLILRSEFEPAIARAWLIGSNPDLEDHAPIELLHDGGRAVDVFNAAAAFVLPEPTAMTTPPRR